MIELHVMVGLPGSGKSYYANKIKEEMGECCILLSSDLIRKELTGNESDQSVNNATFKALFDRLWNALNVRKNVVLDATNTTLKTRKKIFDHIADIREKGNIKVIAHIVALPVEMCIIQDRARERTVGADVIKKFLYSFQCPQYFEGFDDIEIIYPKKEDFGMHKYTVSNIRDMMNSFIQFNPHHKYTLGVHCRGLAMHYNSGLEPLKYVAGLYHDIGKLFTQVIDDEGIAHYYSHDSVGAYYFLTHPEILKSYIESFTERQMLFIMFYINYHMRAHRDFRSPKAERKYRKLFGDEMYNSLIEFADYDIIASGTAN